MKKKITIKRRIREKRAERRGGRGEGGDLGKATTESRST